jgi:hypothetical protein
MKPIFAPIDPKPWRKLVVMVPVAVMVLSGPFPARAQSENASQLQHSLDSPEQMAAHETAPNTEVQPSPGSDRPMRAPSRKIDCDRNETVVGGRCVAKHTDKPHKPHKEAQRVRERDVPAVRRARVTEERPAKGNRLCWTQDGRAFSVASCN